MDRELLMAPRILGLVGRLTLALMAGVVPAMALPLAPAPAHGAVDPATAGDDRRVFKGFLTGAPLTNRRLLDDLAMVHEDDFIGNLAGKSHLMGDDQHRHAVFGQIPHDLKHLCDQFWV